MVYMDNKYTGKQVTALMVMLCAVFSLICMTGCGGDPWCYSIEREGTSAKAMACSDSCAALCVTDKDETTQDDVSMLSFVIGNEKPGCFGCGTKEYKNYSLIAGTMENSSIFACVADGTDSCSGSFGIADGKFRCDNNPAVKIEDIVYLLEMLKLSDEVLD